MTVPGTLAMRANLAISFMALENVMAALSESREQLAGVIEIIEAIPDGAQLPTFPNHGEGPLCWCRPRIIFSAGAIVIEHKDLFSGEFDC